MTTRIVYIIFATLLFAVAVALSIGIYQSGAGVERALYFPVGLATAVGARFLWEATKVDPKGRFFS